MGAGRTASGSVGSCGDRVAADRRARRPRSGDCAVRVTLSRRTVPHRAGRRRGPAPIRSRPVSVGSACGRDVLFLLEGGAATIEGARAGAEITPPAVIGFEDVLQGTAFYSTVRALEPTVCFRITADDFMTMVSDNVLLAQSLFGLILASDTPRVPFAPLPQISPDRSAPARRRPPDFCVRIRCCRGRPRRSCWR